MSKTPEEKAREYALERHGTHIAFEPDRFESRVAYLSGYHSRDEEVKELREALNRAIDLICQGTEYEVEIKRYREFIEKAKQLLKE